MSGEVSSLITSNQPNGSYQVWPYCTESPSQRSPETPSPPAGAPWMPFELASLDA